MEEAGFLDACLTYATTSLESYGYAINVFFYILGDSGEVER